MTDTIPAIKITTKYMSEALYNYLCESQIGEHAYGEDAQGNSVEITWSSAHEEFQIINRYDGKTDIYYDHFSESSWENEDPVLLRDMCERLGLLEDIQAVIEDKLMDEAWELACEAEGYATGEVPDWAIQMVSDTQQEIFNKLVEAI